jgi:hypothetical protein
MRDSLADNLNLTGTARFNLTIHHKLRLSRMGSDDSASSERSKIPAAWETVVSYFNQSELNYVNKLAIAAGIDKAHVPFSYAETLREDSGERFFSEYLVWLTKKRPKTDSNGLCLCDTCSLPTHELAASTSLPEEVETPTEETTEFDLVEAATQPTATRNTTVDPPSPIQIGTPPQAPIQNVPPPKAAIPALLPPPPTNTTALATTQQSPTILWFNPFGPVTTFCCYEYMIYCFNTNRRGRPPHNLRCYNRPKNKIS